MTQEREENSHKNRTNCAKNMTKHNKGLKKVAIKSPKRQKVKENYLNCLKMQQKNLKLQLKK